MLSGVFHYQYSVGTLDPTSRVLCLWMQIVLEPFLLYAGGLSLRKDRPFSSIDGISTCSQRLSLCLCLHCEDSITSSPHLNETGGREYIE